MVSLDDINENDLPTIPDYFKGKTIFITGGSGFLGKVLIEKLLYTCTELDRIYILLRNKHNIKPKERLASIYNSTCFDRLRKEKPGAFESKVFYIAGDVSELGLGMSDDDRSLIINRTNIIFHVAANVKFDDHLAKATLLIVRGARELAELAKATVNLESFIYISTAYSNTNRNPIDEVMYPPFADWKETIELCETADRHTVQVLTSKYIGPMPNTYVFSKQLAEAVMYDYKEILPIVNIRPSIVSPSYSEPLPGWVDNFNGPVGSIVAGAKGIHRTTYATSKKSDYIPVDMVIRGTIIAAWIRGTQTFKASSDIPVYNMCAGGYNNMTAEELSGYAVLLGNDYPLNFLLWCPGVVVTNWKLYYNIRIFLVQLVPAMFIDLLLWLLGRKPLLMNIQRKIYTANYIALSYYTTNEWKFNIDNFLKLRTKLKESDREEFNYEIEDFDVLKYMRLCLYGGRKYLLKETDEDLPTAKINLRRMKILDKVVKTILCLLFIWMLLKSEPVKYYARSVLDFISF